MIVRGCLAPVPAIPAHPAHPPDCRPDASLRPRRRARFGLLMPADLSHLPDTSLAGLDEAPAGAAGRRGRRGEAEADTSFLSRLDAYGVAQPMESALKTRKRGGTM